jgi:hypothetical protein
VAQPHSIISPKEGAELQRLHEECGWIGGTRCPRPMSTSMVAQASVRAQNASTDTAETGYTFIGRSAPNAAR